MERLKAIIAVIFFIAALIFSESVNTTGNTSNNPSEKTKITKHLQKDTITPQYNTQSVSQLPH